MSTVQATSRRAGILYFVFSLLAIAGYVVIPGRFLVAGDAAATVRGIAAGETLYRAGILAALTAHITFIFLALTLYELFREVDRRLARLLAVLVCVGACAEIVALTFRTGPLVLATRADELAAIAEPQRQALALGSLRLGNQLSQIVSAFWGLWLFPFGLLTIRSGWFPKVLGILQFVSGAAYALACATRLVFPAQFQAIAPVLMPFYFGELGMVFWLLLVGARVPRAEARAALAS